MLIVNKTGCVAVLLSVFAGLVSCGGPGKVFDREEAPSVSETEGKTVRNEEGKKKYSSKAVVSRKKVDSENGPGKEKKDKLVPVAGESKASSEDNGELSGESVTPKNGIRFTFKDVPRNCLKGAYMLTNEGQSVRIEPLIGLFGPRIAFPEDKTIVLYDQPSAEGKPQGNIVLTASVPAGIGDRAIGIISSTGEGQIELIFVDERRLVPGNFYLHNVTSERLGLQIDKEEMFEMAPGENRFLEFGFSSEGNDSHPARLYRKNEKGEWYVTRQFVFSSRARVAEAVLMVWNKGLGKPDMQKIVLAPELPSKRPVVRPRM